MKIKIVNANPWDNNGIHVSQRAWQFSRTENDAPLNEILSMDLSVNEMPVAIMEVESTIIEREVITTMRDHSMWARTTRVDDPLKFKIPKALSVFHHYVTAAEFAKKEMEKAQGNQDEFRLKMPLFALAKYTLSLNLRSIIKLQRYFAKLSVEMENGFMCEVYADAAYEFRKVVNVLTGRRDSKEYLRQFNAVDINPIPKNFYSGRAGDFVTVAATVPFSLRTHLIRHRMLLMQDNMKAMMTNGHFHELTLETPIAILATSSVSFWTSILSKRSCWLAHYGMWKPIIEQVQKFIGIEETMLPCNGDGAACPYKADNVARYDGKDPNPPCPIYLYKGDKVSYITEHGKKLLDVHVKEDNRPIFWHGIIDSL